MIGMLRGHVVQLRPLSVIVDVNGVGYNVFVPVSLLGFLENNSEVLLHVYTLVKEDRIHLYGFQSLIERDLFEVLLSVSGLGAHSALLLLSHFSPDELFAAVKNADPSLLVRIPGIGRKKAEKIIFELKAKEKKLSLFISGADVKSDSRKVDVIAALCSLGFEENRVSALYDQVYVSGDAVETVIKKILRIASEK